MMNGYLKILKDLTLGNRSARENRLLWFAFDSGRILHKIDKRAEKDNDETDIDLFMWRANHLY